MIRERGWSRLHDVVPNLQGFRAILSDPGLGQTVYWNSDTGEVFLHERDGTEERWFLALLEP